MVAPFFVGYFRGNLTSYGDLVYRSTRLTNSETLILFELGIAVDQRSLRRVALIGCDEQAIEVVRRGVTGGQISVAAAIEAPTEWAAALRQVAPETRFDVEWESILDGESVDVIVFSAPQGPFLDLPERRVEQLKKAAAAGVDLVLFHPACDGLLGYELEMARSTARGRIITACPDISHPIFRRLTTAMEQGELAGIEQVIVERSAEETDKLVVLQRFAKDAMLLRDFFGSPTKLSANGPSPETENWSSLAVLLTLTDGPSIRWNIDPTGTLTGMRITIIANSGRAQLTLDEIGEVGTLTIANSTQSASRGSDWADAIWSELATPRTEKAAEEDLLWLGACRDLDLAAAAQRSIHRGRSVELKVDRATEASNFKGVMSAWGCLLLLGALLFFAIWSVVGALELTWTNGASEASSSVTTDPTKVRLISNLSWRYLPMFLLALMLVGFLGLQFLQLIIKPEQKKASEEIPPTPQEPD